MKYIASFIAFLCLTAVSVNAQTQPVQPQPQCFPYSAMTELLKENHDEVPIFMGYRGPFAFTVYLDINDNSWTITQTDRDSNISCIRTFGEDSTLDVLNSTFLNQQL